MQNQLNSMTPNLLYPQNQLQNGAMQGTYPAPSVGAVNIQIFNPTANPQPQAQNPYPQGFYQANPCPNYPCNYNNLMNSTPAPTYNSTNPIDPSSAQPMNLNSNQEGVASNSPTDSQTNTKDVKENKPKVILTDDYIKTLENYLNSQDKKIRSMGAKELFERFKEDETRKDDPALTALLNKVLQDPTETVKFIGLTALDTGYANGNDETMQILTNMQNTDTSYGEDASLASQILLKLSANKSNKTATEQNQSTALPLEPSLHSTESQSNKMPPVETGTLLNDGASNSTLNQNGTDKSMISPMNNAGGGN